MIVGMDFGTTNSGMAVYDGRTIRVLPLDPANPNPRVVRTAVYVTNDQTIHIGRAAVDQYFEQNIGRPVKMQKVWIGELEVYGADMYYVTDAYAWVDMLSPGRLFLSVKTSLRDADYAGTIVGQFYYSLENLIALYLTVTKQRAEQLLGHEIRQVVLGRPVRFATDDEHDRLAQARLLQAAFRAGYEKVYLQYEPIAAAFSYETMVDKEQHVLIFDFGGGTLDITVMRLGGGPKRRAVLATGGIPVAGDVFDRKLVRAKLPRHFGEGSLYGPRHKALTIPRWIYDAFSDWQTILELQSAENKQILREIAQSARRRYQIEALSNLVSSNYGLKMFDVVEQAKRTLSEKRGAEIRLEGPGFQVHEFVTRTEFEGIIRGEIRAIEDHLLETVRASGLRPEEIDAVIRTGGSAQIPAFYEMLCRHFGEAKVHSVDVFSSVTAGLGIIAHGIEAGEVDLVVHTPDEIKLPPEAKQTRPNVSPINLELLQRRIAMEAGTAAQDGRVAQIGLALLGEANVMTAVTVPAARFQQATPLSLAEWAWDRTTMQALTAGLDEQLLLVTSKYRFLLATPRQLADLRAMGLTITDLHQLEQYETICALARWDALKRRERLLLVTSLGFARPYPLDILRTNIEAPAPLRFDRPLPGNPVAVLGTQQDEQLVLVSREGRAVRLDAGSIRLAGVQAFNCGQDDRVVGAVLAAATAEIALVTADGYGNRLLAEWIPVAPRPNSKGKSMIARRSELVGVSNLTPDTPLWLVTTKRLVGVDAGRLPLEDSTKTERLVKLGADEWVQTLI